MTSKTNNGAGRYTFTKEGENHLVIRKNGKAIFEGSYEAFCADGDVEVPQATADAIHAYFDRTEDEAPRDTWRSPCNTGDYCNDYGD